MWRLVVGVGMGICTSKPPKANPFATKEEIAAAEAEGVTRPPVKDKEEIEAVKKSPFFPFYSPSPAHSLFSKKSSPANNKSASSTPGRFFKRPFPPPSPAKHIKAVLARRHGKKKVDVTIPEGEEGEGDDGGVGLDRSFGFSKQFTSRYETGEEVGRGHFGYTCSAKGLKGEMKGQEVAVKVIPKAKVGHYMILCLIAELSESCACAAICGSF